MDKTRMRMGQTRMEWDHPVSTAIGQTEGACAAILLLLGPPAFEDQAAGRKENLMLVKEEKFHSLGWPRNSWLSQIQNHTHAIWLCA